MFLRNGWYAAIWSKDLQARPIGRTFLNEKVVLFRNGAAKPPRWRTAAAIARRRSRRVKSRATTSRAAITG
jgi:phenylpropionate dioxygenase-like ring-hydroxylating dioxygenase large terminal subunit